MDTMKSKAFPVFFSVASADIEFAERVWEPLPDDWVYLYSKTGEEAAHVWDEISERELPRAKILVIFWSRNYLKAQGCVREIKQAAGLVDSGLLRPLVLRLDDCPISWTEEFPEADKATFEALGKALNYRTSHPGISVDHARELVARVAEPLLSSDTHGCRDLNFCGRCGPAFRCPMTGFGFTLPHGFRGSTALVAKL